MAHMYPIYLRAVFNIFLVLRVNVQAHAISFFDFFHPLYSASTESQEVRSSPLLPPPQSFITARIQTSMMRQGQIVHLSIHLPTSLSVCLRPSVIPSDFLPMFAGED